MTTAGDQAAQWMTHDGPLDIDEPPSYGIAACPSPVVLTFFIAKWTKCELF
jgi:hypothetical protein